MYAEPLSVDVAHTASRARRCPRTVGPVVALVARHNNVSVSSLLASSRSRKPIARARQLAMYLSHVVLGQSMTDVGSAFGRDRTTVSYACGLIEDLRDDPKFDADVSALELELQGEGR